MKSAPPVNMNPGHCFQCPRVGPSLHLGPHAKAPSLTHYTLRKLAPAAYLMAGCSLLRSWLKCHVFIEDSVQLKQNRLLVTSLSCFPFFIVGIAAVYLPIACLSTRIQAPPAWAWSVLLTDTTMQALSMESFRPAPISYASQINNAGTHLKKII